MTQSLLKVLFLIMLTGNLSAQENENAYNNSGKKYYTSNYASVNFNYSLLKTFKKSSFHKYFENNYGSKFSQDTYAIGLNMAGPILIASGSNYEGGKHFDGHLGIQQQFTKRYQPSDSSSYNFQAFHFNFAIGKDLLFFWNNIDLPIRFGIDGGMAFLKENSTRNRNPFLNLIGQAELRFVIWKFVLGSKIEIGYDITSKNWKPKKNNINDELSYKSHYYSLQFSLGYNIFEPIKKWHK